MASAGTGGALPHNFILTPQQQNLLFAALNSNKAASAGSSANTAISLSPESFKSPTMPTSDGTQFQESPFLDNYDYDFGDSSFDFSFASNNGDQPRMIGDVPGTEHSESPENDTSDKRSHPDDEDDEDSPGHDPKRHGSNDKVPKKPGRKPLTSEPSSKRKAQNRAAQRAFRERKEKHLKDLETKVEELQKASEAANNENTLLRAQVERMTTELNQYKQKMTVLSNSKSVPREKISLGNSAVNNLSDVSFQFEFPKFGMLPGPPIAKQQSNSQQAISPKQQKTPTTISSNNGIDRNGQNGNKGDISATEDFNGFPGAFTPSMATSVGNASRTSLDSVAFSLGGGANTSSPSASSQSHGGPSSSCGTSPEPFTQSPMGSKPLETLTTIGEEQPSMSTADQPFAQFSDVDFNTNFDWLSQQNGGQFDPQLFGGYRESQDNVLSGLGYDDLFNDPFADADFLTPYNMAAPPQAPKKNLIEQIDAQQDACDDDAPKKSSMNCSQIWDKLQALPKAQNGEFDLDGLCSELTKKAKCSGSGPVVGEADFDTILKKYMGKDVSTNHMASSLGIEVKGDKQSLGVGLP
jgi:AP-1-like factor